MRCELAYALEKNKNIVPIMLAGFTAFPDNLPDDIRKVVRKNGPKYDSYYFDDFYRRLKSDFLETKPEEQGDEDAYVTQLLKRLSVLKSVPEPTDGQQAELGETYYELGRLASLTTAPTCSITCRRRWRSSAGSPKRARALPCADRRTGTAGAAEQTDVQALYRTVSPLRRRALRIAAGRSALLDRPGGGGAQLSAHGGGRRGAGRGLHPVRLPDPKKQIRIVTELEKMLAGGLYDFSDAELAEQFREGRRRVERFNRTPADDAAAYAARSER